MSGTILICIIILLIIRLLGEMLSKKKAPAMIEPAPQKTGIEQYHEYAHRMILRHGFKTIDHIMKKCEYRMEERDGLTFQYWTDKHGNNVKMQRSDGTGYIQMCNEHGEAFGVIWIEPDREPEANVICNSIEFQTNMQWFLAHH